MSLKLEQSRFQHWTDFLFKDVRRLGWHAIMYGISTRVQIREWRLVDKDVCSEPVHSWNYLCEQILLKLMQMDETCKIFLSTNSEGIYTNCYWIYSVEVRLIMNSPRISNFLHPFFSVFRWLSIKVVSLSVIFIKY